MAIDLDPTVLLKALQPLPDPSTPGPPKREPPVDDVPKRRGLKPSPIDSVDEIAVEPEEIPAMISDATERYLSDPMPDAMLLIAAPAGTGKTTEMVRLAERRAASSDRVMYAGPNHAFFEDLRGVSAAVGQIPPDQFEQWWYEWQGRHGGDEHGLGAMCRWSPQMDAWLARGYTARSFCKNPRICGWNYVHASCRYYHQEQEAGPIIYAQHQHVALGHLMMDRIQLLIGDELPISAFLSTTNGKPGWIIPPAFIVPKGMQPGPLETMLRALRAMSTVRTTTWEGSELLEALGGATHVIDVLKSARVSGALALEPALRSADAVHDAPYFHLFTLAELLSQEADEALAGRPCINRVRVTNDGLVLLVRRIPRQLPPHVIWCDATGDPRLYRHLFGRPIAMLRPRVKLRGKVFQVYASLNNKGSLLDGTERTAVAAAAVPDGPERKTVAHLNDEKWQKLRKQVAQIIKRGGYKRPVRISYKGMVEHLTTDADPNDSGYFGAQRGTNKFENCDCLIVVGAQQPTTLAIVDTAAQVFHKRTTPFDTTWNTFDRSYAGQPWSWPIGGFWNDPDLQALLEQFREAEILQAVHRARPIRYPIDVWLLTNVPIPDLPVQLVSLADLFDAPPEVDPYRWPEVVQLAEERMNAAGIVLSSDLVTAGLCQARAATKYIRALADQQGWRVVTAPAAGRGKPPLACVKH